MTEPQFVSLDGPAIIAEMVELYQNITGKALQPAQPERLLINAFAYRELVIRQQIQNAALQTLVSFASAPSLDYLGELVGVTRLSSSAASCVIRFSLITGHNGVVIPEGTRVASNDGKVVFLTTENIEVPVGTFTADVQALAQTLGVVGNGYAAGEISEILDPLPFITDAANLATTDGGADTETDDVLRARIKLAPERFSNAGSKGAYEFHAKSASPAILDVAITSPTPGTVNIYPLAGSLPTATSILNLVAAACNDEKVRPLTDTVVVLSPTGVTYDVEVELECYTDANTSEIEAQVTAALNAFATQRSKQIGLDVMRSQITALCMVEGVYDVTIVQPAADVIVSATQVPTLAGPISVTITGLTDG